MADYGSSFINALTAGQESRLRQEQLDTIQRRRGMAPDVQAAIGGDTAALGRIAAIDPDYAIKIGPVLEAMDAKQRASAKAAADYTYSAANAVLQANPADRPMIYRQMIAQGRAQGFPLKGVPEEYSPQLDGWLRTQRQMAVPVVEQWKVEQDRPQPMGGAVGAAPAAAGGSSNANAIAGIESAGQPNNGYGALGPVANAQGDRAYGRYQVMGANVGPWTQEVLGKAMTPQEFLANPQAQDAVFNAKFGQYVQKYGSPQAASRAWFAGEGGMNNPNAADVNGMTPARYEQKFTAGLPTGAPLNGGIAPPDVVRNTQVAGPPMAGPSPVTQGDGNVQMAQAPAESSTRGLKLPPGTRMMGVKGVPVVKDGAVLVIHQDGSQDWMPLPQRKEPGNQPPAGPFGGTGMDAQAMNIVLKGDPSSPEYAAAFAHLAQPKTQLDQNSGQLVQITPDMSWARPPVRGAAPAAGSAPTPTPGVPTAPQPGAKGVTVETVPGLTPKMTDAQAGAALYADRMRESNATIEKFGTAGLDAKGKALEKVPFAGNYLQSPEYQLYEQARRDFVNAVLRRESGAVISDQEFANAEKQYFPQPGDKPETLKQKARNREVAIEGISRAAGPSYKAKESAPDVGGPQKQLSPEEAAKLPPGTKFIGLDGVERTRH